MMLMRRDPASGGLRCQMCLYMCINICNIVCVLSMQVSGGAGCGAGAAAAGGGGQRAGGAVRARRPGRRPRCVSVFNTDEFSEFTDDLSLFLSASDLVQLQT